ncbi:MAG TPA: glycosyltransferase [Candidatus Nanoarchaeia archaeon]|nr:glycosyltransferase [Candidatus Nanoarchaeia archaeon]
MKFSLIIPVAPYRGCEIMGSIKKLDYQKKEFEVITEHGYNPSDNRNRAIRKAKGRYLVFLDDDGILERDYLKQAERFLKKNPDVDIVGGPQLTPPSDKYFARTSGYVMSSWFGTYTMSSRYSKRSENLDADEYSLTSANCIAKREVFRKIKPFDPRLFPGEDPELYARAKKAGFRLAYTPALIMYHRRRAAFSSYCKQFFKYGFVRMQKEKISKTPVLMVNPVFFIPSLFVLYLITLPFWLAVHAVFIWPLIAYFVLVILFSVYEAHNQRDLKAFPLLPFLYLSMHVSYGLGMIWNLLRKKP